MRELICITCPIGCRLEVETAPDGGVKVTGNRCPRGAVYAREEFLAPKRVVTATCRIKVVSSETCAAAAGEREASARSSVSARGMAYKPRRVPVRTTQAFPRERIPEALEAIYATEVELPVSRGTVLIHDLLGMGIELIATRDMQ